MTAEGPKTVTVGEILVEVMADRPGHGFAGPLGLTGPFPSGAPAIFIDQVAKLGHPSGIISCVGNDDFGRLNLKRLADDGVDTSGVEVLDDYPTGTAFVRYRPDGGRDFVFNIANSAYGQTHMTPVAEELVAQCGHIHVSGPSLISTSVSEVVNAATRMVKAKGGTVSFDPNVRKEVLARPGMAAALARILAQTDIFLPSGDELTLLTGASHDEAAIAELLAMGVSAIVVKKGPQGASYHDANGTIAAPGYPVRELDPTGAGDCFDATFVTCRLQGRSVPDSLDYANAAGARAVTERGPMEGTSSFAQLDAFRLAARRGPPRLFTSLERTRAGAKPLPAGITSVCSAHPLVVEAALRQGLADSATVLIEATCNQVNHRGGYTGLTPAAFRDQVYAIADQVGFPRPGLVLGGDHLGPNPWRHLPASAAMAEAENMVAAYVEAGYEKIHLDASMACLGDPARLPSAVVAQRAAQLALVAERSSSGAPQPPRYVIGTEVPVPGGAMEEIDKLEVTSAEAVLGTFSEHEEAFSAAGAARAFDAVVAMVVQPGVEFDDRKVVVYEPERARALCATLSDLPGLVFEAHSTDYQPVGSLARLVADGFAILKVGPGLTFALREALYGLDHIALALNPGWTRPSLAAVMETIMVSEPGYWEPYYHGEPDEQRALRHFSYSDRIRYYWAHPRAEQAVARLLSHLDSVVIPEPLVSQFLPALYERVAGGVVAPKPKTLLLEAVGDVLRRYAQACREPQAQGPSAPARKSL